MKLSLDDRYTFRPPEGETWQEMDERIDGALRKIAGLHFDTVAIITHAGPIRVLLSTLKVKTKAATINYIPGLGSWLIEEFDPASV
jgi:broad specificity phosphatase PhoE